jgi:DNA-binding MarR family transcriptional regulator
MSRSAARRESTARRRLSLLLQIYSVHARMAELVERELGREGVDPRGYAALSSIGAWGPMGVTELAATLGMPLTTTSDVVRRLEARGLVTRRTNPGDARSTLLELTTEGDRVWRAGWPALQRATTAISRGLHDVDATRESLDELADALGSALEARTN